MLLTKISTEFVDFFVNMGFANGRLNVEYKGRLIGIKFAYELRLYAIN